MREPIADFSKRGINSTLHGRSVYRDEDVPGHNVFRGYSTWETNGHVGIGDALDLAAHGGTPLLAVCAGNITRWYNDTTRLEVCYLEGMSEGRPVVAVYAHVNVNEQQLRRTLKEGDTIAWVRGDLNEPHLHFELWIGEKALAAPTPGDLRQKMLEALRQPAFAPVKVIGRTTGTVLETLKMVPGGDHIADQGKLYVEG